MDFVRRRELTMIRRLAAVLGLFAIIALNGVALHRWSKVDTRPLSWDESIHTKNALEYRRRIQTEGWASVLKPAYFNYPPLYHLTLAAAIPHTDDVADAGATVNFFYLMALIIAVYAIARRYAGVGQSLLAAFMVSALPITATLSRAPMIDLALTAWVSVSIWFLLNSEGFSRPLWSFAFAIAMAGGLLTKESAPAYVFGPFLWATVLAFRQRTIRWWILSLLLGAVLVSPWYLVNLVPIATMLGRVTGLPPASGMILTGHMHWLWYPLSLFESMNVFFLVIGLVGLVVGLIRPKSWPLILWYLMSIFLFSLIHNRNTRYSFPALPALVILGVIWWPENRRAITFAVGAVAVGMFAFLQWAPARARTISILGQSVPLWANEPPHAEDWHHRDIIREIEKLKDRSRPANVVVLSNAPFFHSTSLDVTRETVGAKDFWFGGPSKRRWLEFVDFILLKTGDLGPEFTLGTIKSSLEQVNTQPWFKKVYPEVARWKLPDGSEAILLQTKPQPAGHFDLGFFNMDLGEMKLPNIVMRNVSVRLIPGSPADQAIGKFKLLKLSAEALTYRDIPFQNVRVEFVNPQINLPELLADSEIHLLNLEKLKVNGTLSSRSILEYASAHAAWLQEPSIMFEGSNIIVAGKLRKIPVVLKASVNVHGEKLVTHLQSATLAKIPIPHFLVSALTDRVIPISPNPEIPFRLDVTGLEGRGETVTVVSQ